ncbi:PQQ-dependent sugar dehydrogenase [Halovenus rubra]|uniref:PQQ-dependent sugar dehydrogenase n=2 Tax=Halovenus rubra TaxID=869890 RepID=A0ACC7DXH9_9EURY|nr:PQQ-dependent sugar dehydrogenase [Halovenus rubra]
MNRRQFLSLGAGAGMAGLAGCTLGTATDSLKSDGLNVRLEDVVSGVSFPTGMVFLPNGDRLIIERTGQLLRHTDSGLAQGLFHDVSGQMAEVEGERGLVGIALHPNFEENSRFYLRYSGQLPESLSADEYSHVAVLAEYEANADRTGVVQESERRILTVPEPGPMHNAGSLTFGPEGYLYVALGDGQRTSFNEDGKSWWYDQGQAAQNVTDNLLGGIHRIDVDNPEDGKEYGIPDDNPLVGKEGRDEYYAWGFRNPYKMSIDDGRVFVGDVGEHTRESVYLVEKGANHGWPIVEGSSCAPSTSIGHTIADNPLNVFNPKTWQALTNRVSPVKVCATPKTSKGSIRDPIVEYQRTGSRAVTGGYVYRGEALPELQGKYVFGDYMVPAPLFAVDPAHDGKRPYPLEELTVENTESGRLNSAILSFARDPNDEMYVLTTGFEEGSGLIRRIAAAE